MAAIVLHAIVRSGERDPVFCVVGGVALFGNAIALVLALPVANING